MHQQNSCIYNIQKFNISYIHLQIIIVCRPMELRQTPSMQLQMAELTPNNYYRQNLYPLCIVWTILPCITWFIPVIGHTGACSSKGIIYDFLGMHINVKQMAFCSPRKYVRINISEIPGYKGQSGKTDEEEALQKYDQSLKQANLEFRKQYHNLCCNNCHHHVARFLNLLEYRGKNNWTQVSIWWLFIWQGKYVTWWAPLQVYGPFLLVIMLIVGVWAISAYSTRV